MNFKKPNRCIPNACTYRPQDLVLKMVKSATVVEAKPSIAARRIRALKDLVYQTFVGDLVLEGHQKRFDIYEAAKPRIRELGSRGGVEFEHALTAVQYAWTSEKDWQDAVSTITLCK